MKCIRVLNPGPDSQLVYEEQPLPLCQPDQILVLVHAIALNRADLLQRQGKYPPPPEESDIPGLEISGDIIAMGNKVEHFKVGDRIYGLVGSGAYAEYCCVNQHLARKIPNHWDYYSAAALPEALLTAHASLFDLGKLNKEEHFLIHGAGSGIACMAIQMAAHVKAHITTTVGSEAKIVKAKQLGANTVINYKTQDFSRIIEKNSLDVILDFVGGDYVPKHIDLLTKKGRLVQIASMKDHEVRINLFSIIRKRLQILGFILRAQSLIEKSTLWQAAHQRWEPALLAQDIKPIIDSIFDFDEMELAHQHMLSNQHFGKIVVKMPEYRVEEKERLMLVP